MIKCSKCGVEFEKGDKGSLGYRCILCIRKYRNQNNKKHKERIKQYKILHKQEIQKQMSERHIVTRKIILEHYGNECVFCGETNQDCLTIDHINGGGKQHRKQIGTSSGTNFYKWLIKNNFPQDLQILCMNCQRIKVLENKECCPIFLKRKTPLKILLGNRQYRYKTKRETLNYYGGKCVKCGYSNLNALEFDHINDNGKEHRKQVGHDVTIWLKQQKYPSLLSVGLQVLCANCNHIKEKNRIKYKMKDTTI